MTTTLERYQVVTDSFTHHIKADYIENTTRLLKESTALCASTTMNPDFEIRLELHIRPESPVVYRAEGDPEKRNL